MLHARENKNQQKYRFDPSYYTKELVGILKEIEQSDKLDQKQLNQILRKYPKDGEGFFSKSQLIKGYRELAGSHGLSPYSSELVEKIRMKPVRTISGVTPVTVLTKPFPCPGKCIFCPNDVRMPKSYLSNEPGAQRAERNHFDPYLQTWNRLKAFYDIGHPVDKVELIVLGGTWSFYPEKYQIWFVKRMFDALNDFSEGEDGRDAVKPSVDVSEVTDVLEGIELSEHGLETTYNEAISKLYVEQELAKMKAQAEEAAWAELETAQQVNETAEVRCVGLVLETRPDFISEEEVVRLRRLGTTKTQIGLQSLQDSVLEKNKRGHDVAASRRAMHLLRQAGMKIHAHWMPNLYGSSVTADIEDYRRLFRDPDFKPDELKIYPCSLIDGTELMSVHQKGDWEPYSQNELLEVLTNCFRLTPEYCRLTRVVRDIPSDDIVTGNKKTNFRQIAKADALEKGYALKDIRAREVRDREVSENELQLDVILYETSVSQEQFLQFVTKDDHSIAGFLRLSLPNKKPFISALQGSAIIREVHVYGKVVRLGESDEGAAQHLGLGKQLMMEAEKRARDEGFSRIAVISAVGTREYYRKLGYEDGELYMVKKLTDV